MGIITATSNNGRLYLGYGEENCVGKSLGNGISTCCFFTSITKLFGFSIDVDIDGKKRCVNKKV